MGNNKSAGSKEHSDLVCITCKYFRGNPIIVSGNSTIKGKYFPDVVKSDIDIECELLKNSYLKNKINKWDKSRKKILIIGLPKIALDNFNEFYVLNLKGELIKL